MVPAWFHDGSEDVKFTEPYEFTGFLHGSTMLPRWSRRCKVRAALNVRFPGGGRQPRVIFTDRGNGFYNAGSGAITEEFRGALRRHNLRGEAGVGARPQSSGPFMRARGEGA